MDLGGWEVHFNEVPGRIRVRAEGEVCALATGVKPERGDSYEVLYFIMSVEERATRIAEAGAAADGPGIIRPTTRIVGGLDVKPVRERIGQVDQERYGKPSLPQ